MTKQQYRQVEAYMLQCMENPPVDTVHDKLHIYRVLHYALQIAQAYPDCDLDVIITAALLHDIGREQERQDPSVSHARAGSEMAYAFLQKAGYPAAFCGAVKNCIAKHSHSAQVSHRTREEEIVFDADKLDLIGNVGAARALLYGGQIGEPMYLLDGAGQPTPGHPSEAPSLFREYHRKLQNLEQALHTPIAKELARGQQQNMNDYFEKLQTEIRSNHKIGSKMLESVLQ